MSLGLAHLIAPKFVSQPHHNAMKWKTSPVRGRYHRAKRGFCQWGLLGPGCPGESLFFLTYAKAADHLTIFFNTITENFPMGSHANGREPAPVGSDHAQPSPNGESYSGISMLAEKGRHQSPDCSVLHL